MKIFCKICIIAWLRFSCTSMYRERAAIFVPQKARASKLEATASVLLSEGEDHKNNRYKIFHLKYFFQVCRCEF